jgi:hypothetical protein
MPDGSCSQARLVSNDTAVMNAEDQNSIEQISARHAKEHPSVGQQVIADAVETTCAQYQDSHIRDFLPVLVERKVTKKLNGL